MYVREMASGGPPYRPRVLDRVLEGLLGEFPAVALEGPKAVGKTATARRLAGSEHRLDGPEGPIAAADPTIALSGHRPVLVDEWQRVPATWDAVRRAVDDGAPPGSFLLTGSARAHGPHSGAGRILSRRLRPMTLGERQLQAPTVSLAGLLLGTGTAVEGTTDVNLEVYADQIVRSGFPGAQGLSAAGAASFLDGYLQRVVEHEFEEIGQRVRRPELLRRWLRAYAAASATTATLETIRDAAGSGATPPSRSAVDAYRNALERLFLLDEVPAWRPTGSPLARITGPPKHHLADPALAAGLLGVDAGALLGGAVVGGRPLLGLLFVSLAALTVRVFADAAGAMVSHLRTKGGEHEVDLVVERRDGPILAIEVKLGAAADDGDVRHLRWLRDRLGPDMVDALVLTTGPRAYRRADGIAVVPLALLGP